MRRDEDAADAAQHSCVQDSLSLICEWQVLHLRDQDSHQFYGLSALAEIGTYGERMAAVRGQKGENLLSTLRFWESKIGVIQNPVI